MKRGPEDALDEYYEDEYYEDDYLDDEEDYA